MRTNRKTEIIERGRTRTVYEEPAPQPIIHVHKQRAALLEVLLFAALSLLGLIAYAGWEMGYLLGTFLKMLPSLFLWYFMRQANTTILERLLAAVALEFLIVFGFGNNIMANSLRFMTSVQKISWGLIAILVVGVALYLRRTRNR